MKFKNIGIFLAALFVMLVNFANAQIGPAPPPDSTSGSIDSGAIFLLIAVAVFGYSRIKEKKSKLSGI